MLTVSELHVSYEGLEALGGVELRVAEGQCVALMGSNGAGKTTLLRCVSGLIRPRRGSIIWLGESIHGLPPHEICQRGIIQVPEGRKLFPRLSVLANLELGAYLPHARARFSSSLQWIFQLFPVLRQRTGQAAGTLSGGEQQMLAIARALMARPRLLMLDEPSLGLAPKAREEVFRIIGHLHEQGLTLLLVSQEVVHSLRLAQWGYVLENGHIVLEGRGEDLLADPQVKRAYLGL